MPTVDQTVDGWIRHFASADRDLRWTGAERELSMPLVFDSSGQPTVILAGRIDGEGEADFFTAAADAAHATAAAHAAADAANAKPPRFFAEWKTMNPRYKTGWRDKWRFSPQSLTYGLLKRAINPDCRLFTIRVAFKSDPPTFDHEWFSYTNDELDTWAGEVRDIAVEIQTLCTAQPDLQHWRLNPLSCFKWGPKYPCPYVYACTHQEWNKPQMLAPLPYIPHLQVMRDAAAQPNPPLVLDATAITTYLECPESYRRRYVRGEDEVPSDALKFGADFHGLLDQYYKRRAAGDTFPGIEGASAWPNF